MTDAIRVAMISTGDEVLNGDITDTNAAWLSRRFFEEGLSLHRRITVGDELDDIAIELTRASQCSDVVIVNGGLGPTTDDLSAEAMALAMNVELELSTAWLSVLQAYYQKQGKVMPQSNIKQAMLPAGAEIIHNPVGTACGFFAELNHCQFFFTPGVPSEFKSMVEEQILPRLMHGYPLREHISIHRFYTFGLSESWLNDQFNALPLSSDMSVGYRSDMPFIEVKLISAEESKHISKVTDGIRTIIGDHLVGENLPMLETVGRLLNASAMTLSIAEKYTGGELTRWLNQSDELGAQLLQSWVINAGLRQDQNAFNPFAEAFALAATSRDNAGADIGLASSNAHKGEVTLALSTKHGDWGVMLALRTDKDTVLQKRLCATYLLDMLRRYLEGQEMFPTQSTLAITETLFIPPS